MCKSANLDKSSRLLSKINNWASAWRPNKSGEGGRHKKTMATRGQNVPKFHPLSESVKIAAIECGEVLSKRDTWKTIQIPSDPLGTCDAWDHGLGENLRHLCSNFVDEFPPLQEQSSSSEIRFNAVRFTKPAKVPMTPGVSVDLIPVFISRSTPTVENKRLRIGEYVRLTESGLIGNIDEGEGVYCICLLVLSR
ncbi:hypothetical protein GLAREA_04959 [Glarea lozoyensis ATCC 20868]|uniref:Uncharacterized protein n=1 Tax=Glarea lozoyensis (strain ATCC 20868 / MF5171) TaxID=1116229 RepID=S3DNW7_GLAL2|nr:uncharacterized protein GLAREA_04959 [Glarea lozoyensis ATCC 20868]EPE28168.1 hypothetical protein GLAREA_04959 [Glarea lozoyensis ATCC 20868]